MERQLPQPDRDRLSAMSALVILTYALIRIVVLPTIESEFAVLGLFIRLEFNTRFIMLTLAAVLTAGGADWLVRSHPQIDLDERTFHHWIVPGLASLGVGAILTRIPGGPTLWIGLPIAALLLIAVLVAEFIVVDMHDPRYDLAAVGLTVLSYLLLVGLFFSIRALGIRAIFSIPIVILSSTAVTWRLLRLGGPEDSILLYALLNGWITAQVAWGLHYWPATPLRAALLIGLTIYLGNGVLQAQRGAHIDRARLIEFAFVGTIGLAAILSLA